MFYNAKNGNLKIDDTDMDFISFGEGEKILVLIPGLGDGLRTVKGLAVPFALMYKECVADYKIYVFSRKNKLPEGYTTRDMAADYVRAMRQEGIEKADIVGVSQGGMIAQYIAIDYPEIVNKLALVVTLARPNELMQTVIGQWKEMALKNDYKEIMEDTAHKMYSPEYIKKSRWAFASAGAKRKLKDQCRFLIMADACLAHNAYEEIGKITCPTLIVGAKGDAVLGVEPSYEIAEKIKDSELYIYEDYGHGVYEEAKDFNSRILSFLGR